MRVKPVVVGKDRLDAFFAILSEELQHVKSERPEILFARDRLLSRMRKRAAYYNPKLRNEAISSFIATNASLGATSITLDRGLVANARHFISVVLERLATRFDPGNIQVTLDHSLLADLWRYGPGAGNGVRGTHAAEKIQQAMTCTHPSVPYVLKLRQNNAYFRLFDERNGNDGYTVVEGSRLTTVQKNEDAERTIAIEPVGNMALQLAAGRYLEMALASIGLDITCQQPKNQLLALRGSIDGSIATIDLSKASDMITPALVRLLMPETWYKLLMTLRSPKIDIPGHGWTELNMISTMGNGFTFPLMTLLLVSLIYGYRATRGGPNLRIDWKSTCVFGDDIIVPTHEYEDISQILHQAGLVVNSDKSYSDGPFRESCGGDYFNGYDVTPFYVRSLANDPAIYVAINQVFEWSAKHNLLLHRSLAYLKSCLRGKVHFVPEWFGPDQGFRTAKVSGRFTYLKQELPRRTLSEDNLFAMMLACGGYLTSSGPDMIYTPRPLKTRSVVRKARVPSGYLSGADPLSRAGTITTFIEAYSFLMDNQE